MAGESVSELKDQVERDREAVAAATEQLQAERLGAQALGDAVRQELGALRVTNERLNKHISELTAQLEVERRDTAQARLAAKLADEERNRTARASIAKVERVRDQWQGNERHWLKEIENLREEVIRKPQSINRAFAQLVSLVAVLLFYIIFIVHLFFQ